MLLNWNLNNPAIHKACVDICEGEYERQLDTITAQLHNCGGLRMIMLAGPTSSGKTTTAMKISERLSSYGIGAKIISMDDFYRNREDLPLKEDGKPNYESIESIRVDIMLECLNQLISKGSTVIPRFDFASGRSIPDSIQLEASDNEIFIIEGIHGLHPSITGELPENSFKRVFISIENRVYLDNGEVIMKRDVRFLRRLVRDHQFRGATPTLTFSLWKDVRESENEFILPYKEHADYIIDSLLGYELCVIKKPASVLLSTIGQDSEYYEKAQQLLGQLNYLPSIDEAHIPETSLLREFIGGSKYHG